MKARREWIIATSGGFVFLFAMGAGWLTAGTVSFLVPRPVAVGGYVLQFAPALALAVVLKRVLGLPAVSRDNSLRPLVRQLLMLPLVGAPAIAVVGWQAPAWLPVALAALFGAQLVPFGWLMQTRLYWLLGAAVAAGPALLGLLVNGGVLHFTGLYVGSVLVAGSVVAYRRAEKAASRAQD